MSQAPLVTFHIRATSDGWWKTAGWFHKAQAEEAGAAIALETGHPVTLYERHGCGSDAHEEDIATIHPEAH